MCLSRYLDWTKAEYPASTCARRFPTQPTRLRLQKRAARIIFNAEKTATSVHLFNTLIPFYAESNVNRCTLSYKRLVVVNSFINGNTPVYINDSLIKNSDIHDKTSRYCNLNLSCPRYKK